MTDRQWGGDTYVWSKPGGKKRKGRTAHSTKRKYSLRNTAKSLFKKKKSGKYNKGRVFFEPLKIIS